MVLASDLNTFVRDQQNLTAPAVMSAQGDIVIASGANTPIRLAKSTTSTQYLANTGSSNAPAWNEVALDTGVSGTLPVSNGGTGQTSLTANGALIGNGTSAIASVDMSTKGGLLAGDGSGSPSVLAVGSTADHVLTVDSGETTGMKWAAGGGSPSGMIAYFAGSCPSGWTEYTSARGRYIVGTPSGGTGEGTAGTALSNQENRTVGQHTHSNSATNAANPGASYPAAGTNANNGTLVGGASGNVAGTNAPYIQLTVCEKD